jgi:hypothetical protein
MTTARRPQPPASLTLPFGAAVAAAILAVAGLTASSAEADDAPPVAAVLLSASRPRVVAVDLSPLGAVAGTAGPAAPPTGAVSPTVDGSVPQRWLPLPDGSFESQELPLPEGATGAEVTGLSDAGELAATVGFAGHERDPYLWSASGLTSARAGDAAAHTAAAVGPGGEVMTNAGDAGGPGGASVVRVVAPGGTSTQVTGIAGVRGIAGAGVAGPALGLVNGVAGVGMGTTSTPYVWQAGAHVKLPVFASVLAGPICVSPMLPDGSVAYSGPGRRPSGAFALLAGVHEGGVPGTERSLPLPEGRQAGLGCTGGRDVLAADGTAGGRLRAAGGRPAEAIVWTGEGYTLPGIRPGETATNAVAVASGGRAVLAATQADGSVRLYRWQYGVRTPLTVPDGWRVSTVVELSETGDVLANLVAGDGVTLRPAVWRTGPAMLSP